MCLPEELDKLGGAFRHVGELAKDVDLLLLVRPLATTALEHLQGADEGVRHHRERSESVHSGGDTRELPEDTEGDQGARAVQRERGPEDEGIELARVPGHEHGHEHRHESLDMSMDVIIDMSPWT